MLAFDLQKLDDAYWEWVPGYETIARVGSGDETTNASAPLGWTGNEALVCTHSDAAQFNSAQI